MTLPAVLQDRSVVVILDFNGPFSQVHFSSKLSLQQEGPDSALLLTGSLLCCLHKKVAKLHKYRGHLELFNYIW